MKLRSHIAPLACILSALACLATPIPATAQNFMMPGYIPPGMPYRYGGFYVQAGLQFRNVEKFVMHKQPNSIRFVDTLGVAPFGPCSMIGGVQDTHCSDTIMGSGTGVPGYPPTPTGVDTECPNISGLWYYDNGFINPNGDTYTNPAPPPATLTALWPDQNPWNVHLGGLGRYATTAGTPFNVGVFGVTNASAQIGGSSGTAGFDIDNPPTFRNSFSITWERAMNGILFPQELAAGACGYVASRILIAQGGESNLSFNEQLWTPAFELGYQWGDYFDFFFGFSWFSMKNSFSKVYDTTADTYRRVLHDTFPFTSDNDANWVPGNWDSITVVGDANTNAQILPDAGGLIGFPNRTYTERLDPGVAPLPVVEHSAGRVDVSAYEFKLGARSWTPLYGMGKFGFSIGPLMNLINYRAGSNEVVTYFDDQGAVITTEAFGNINQGWKTTWGVFFGTDVVVLSNAYFVRGSVLYSVQQQTAVNAEPVETQFSFGGVSAVLAGGIQF